MKNKLAASLFLIISVFLSGCQNTAQEPQDTAQEEISVAEEIEVLSIDPALQEAYDKADILKAEILGSESKIQKSDSFIPGETYTGTAYYISNNGSDSNDGLSPDTAFATLAPLEHVNLAYGDAVFFERGSVWRAIELPAPLGRLSGITYSAYGEGEKPGLYGSEENGSGSEKWTLYHSDDSGKKVWVYYRDMSEVGAIALNGEIPVRRDIAYWDHGTYFVMDKDQDYNCSSLAYSVKEHLPDMYCFPELIYPEIENSQWNDDIFVLRNWAQGTSERPVGRLYFRCDEGNPGELYESIEFLQPYSFASYMSGKDTVLDNLCVSFSCLTTGTGDTGWVIQNCEFGWNGGGVCNYRSVLEAEYSGAALGLNYANFGRRGGAVSLNNPNSTAWGNYVHHAFQEGISVEIFEGDAGAADILISGNLVEKCNQPLIICNWDTEIDPNHNFKNLIVENNIVLDTAVDSLYNAEWERIFSAAFTIQGGPNPHDGTVYVRNNIFAMSEGTLIIMPQLNEYMKVFDNNTYIQSEDGIGIIVNWENWYTLEDNVATLMGDEAANIVLVK